MHTLDFIMWFLCIIFLCSIMDVLCISKITHKIDGFIGYIILIVFTVIYIILFAVYPDYNWFDFNINFASIWAWFKW